MIDGCKIVKSKKFKDLTGLKFNHFTAIEVAENRNGVYYWLWKCDCGALLKIKGSLVTRKNKPQKSCKDCYSKRRILHGQTNTKEFFAWRGILSRCNDKNSKSYSSYGGRGIFVCDRWLEFKNFYEDMGKAPSKKHSIDRINNDKGYFKENCRWATSKMQVLNRRNTRYIEYNGIKKSISEWAESLGMHYAKLFNRINRGWDIEKALNKK